MKKNTKKILVKVLALVLCGLMLMGTVVAILPGLTGGDDHSDHDHYVQVD
jgi:hypothetical protein